MSWMFLVDIVFFAVLGLLAFPLLVFVVALILGETFDQARQRLKTFLTEWGEIAPKDLFDKLLNVSGLTVTLVLLGFVAYTANRVGDAALPLSSSVLDYFGSDEVRWSIDSEGVWDEVKRQFRDVTGIGGDRLRWEKAKGEMGKYDVRLFRTVAVLLLVLVIAAVLGARRKSLLKRSGITLAVAVPAFILSNWLWTERQEQYIENLVSRYVSTYMEQHQNALPPFPKDYPGAWPEASNADLLDDSDN